CHLKDFQGTTNPNHVSGNFSQTCQQCHNTVSWAGATFDHSTTGFPLTGAHATVQCSQCHINGNYNLTNTACVSCHLKDFQGSTNPNHVQQGFAQTCQTCHTTSAWQPATFDHSQSGFPLTGAHATTQCSQCHINNNYNITSTTCVSCHLNDYNTATTPINHIQSGFPTTCQNCHDTVLWTDGKFDHSTTGWPLTGFHLTSTQCAQCHVNNNYNLTSANTVCSSCHMNDYTTATSPVNHVAAGFPTSCDLCHDTALWTDGKFDHSTTGWPLTGFHLTSTQCSQCHVNNNYKLTSTACSTCHLNDYNGTNNPNHASAGFPQTCDLCHDTTVWTDATFNHNNTPFPLTGYHATSAVTCAMCHVNNNYTTLPTICSGCHMTDYNGTNNPNHTAAGWPTTCNTCHTTTAWIPATLPTQYHTFFPVTHGNANGVCTTCHQNANDFSVFQCTNCHAKTQTDSNHQGVTGYVYNSTNCYQCHKSG
ncbi:MAG TPA: hypothetical protein VEV41_05985, partial [Terriglobales bacterium]|nr:hypothetical protein [Terriglobales bacterium]